MQHYLYYIPEKFSFKMSYISRVMLMKAKLGVPVTVEHRVHYKIREIRLRYLLECNRRRLK